MGQMHPDAEANLQQKLLLAWGRSAILGGP